MAPGSQQLAAVAIAALSACQLTSSFVAPVTPRTSLPRSPFVKQRATALAPARPSSALNGVSMNLADRFMRVAKANLNGILQKLEDPERVLEQSVEDMQRDLVKVRQSYAEVSATQKRMSRQKEQADQLAAEWYKRAQLALGSSNEELAREALMRRQQQTEVSNSLASQMGTQEQAINSLYAAMQQLEAKINEAKSKKEQLIARARTAKTTQKVNDMLSTVTGGTSMDAFERMAEKVEQLEAEAEVAGQLTGVVNGSLEQQFRALEGSNAVDDELKRMKQALPEGKKTVMMLPGALEDELRAMKEELGQ